MNRLENAKRMARLADKWKAKAAEPKLDPIPEPVKVEEVVEDKPAKKRWKKEEELEEK